MAKGKGIGLALAVGAIALMAGGGSAGAAAPKPKPVPRPKPDTAPPLPSGVDEEIPRHVLERIARAVASKDPAKLRAEAAQLRTEGYHPQAEKLDDYADELEAATKNIPPDATVPTPTPANHPSPATPVRDLVRGMQGADVEQWQLQLRRDGYGNVVADKIFGQLTYAATVEWQWERGLKDDGIVGKNTRAAIGTRPTRARPKPAPVSVTPPAPKPPAPTPPAPTPPKPPAANAPPKPPASVPAANPPPGVKPPSPPPAAPGASMIPPLLVNATLREQPAPQKYDERVKLWQDLLKSRGYRSATTKSDGMFGPNTTAQTKALQKAKGLPQTGVADPVTIAVGHGQTPPKAQAPTPSSAVPPLNVNVASWRSVLKEGNKGQDVRELQQVLGKYGFVVAVDGDFGKGTTAATKLWQTTYARFPDGSGRVLTPDGQFGKNSRDRLLLLEQTPSTIAGTEELLSTAALSAMFAPQLMTFGAIPHLEAGILDELAAELVANLEATRVGEEDRDLVTRWQNANGIAATGNYGPTTAATLIPLGIVPPKPRHWPSKKLWRARSRYQVALREQARRDPARASEWLSAASNV